MGSVMVQNGEILSNGFGSKWGNSVMGQTDLGLNSFSAFICIFRASPLMHFAMFVFRKDVTMEMVNMREKQLFMDGKILVAIVSEVGSAGIFCRPIEKH
ncbi:hypothetical protein CTI12_AA402290 [Artemisia annua]|uniref:Strawberry notch helicase C domain-containing protein n=1 Tax=Artemisia annua TaxID=35608 RepID=A0A2U1M5C0_ARTAN|nr:hypothetical protein CTI12_AA402290 [Artemisia annua]